MFCGCKIFDSELSDWNVSGVTNPDGMKGMFLVVNVLIKI